LIHRSCDDGVKGAIEEARRHARQRRRITVAALVVAVAAVVL
jgi:hypothetical protein